MMKRIEFIGAPGVGKSTLLEKVKSKRDKNDEWVTPFELKMNIAKNEKITRLISKKSIYLLALKLNIYRDKHQLFISRLLARYEKDAHNIRMNDYSGLINMVLKGFAENKDVQPYLKMDYVIYCLNQIKEVGFLDYIGHGKTVVFEESIIHNNPKTWDKDAYIHALHNSNASKVNPLGVIFCDLFLEEHIKRRKNRIIERGSANFSEKGLNKEQFETLCKNQLENSNGKAEVMRYIGVPVLQVDVSENIDDNALRVLEFIRGLTCK